MFSKCLQLFDRGRVPCRALHLLRDLLLRWTIFLLHSRNFLSLRTFVNSFLTIIRFLDWKVYEPVLKDSFNRQTSRFFFILPAKLTYLLLNLLFSLFFEWKQFYEGKVGIRIMKRWFDGENACRNSTCRVPFSIECWLEKRDGGPFVPVKNGGNEVSRGKYTTLRFRSLLLGKLESY